MKVNDVTKWIAINRQASSLFSVIADGAFKSTAVGKDKWLYLMYGSLLQESCHREGFNIDTRGYNLGDLKVRIGIIADNQNDCMSCNSCIGFGTSLRHCSDGEARNITCGNMDICGVFDSKNTAAFGYILVQ